MTPEIGGVFAASDGISAGRTLTVRGGRSGRGQVAVVGFDGQPEVLMAVYTGRLGATVNQPACMIGWTAADAVGRLLRGRLSPSDHHPSS